MDKELIRKALELAREHVFQLHQKHCDLTWKNLALFDTAIVALDKPQKTWDFVSLVREAGFEHCHCFVAENGCFVCQLKKNNFVREVYFSPDEIDRTNFRAEMVKAHIEDALAELDRDRPVKTWDEYETEQVRAMALRDGAESEG